MRQENVNIEGREIINFVNLGNNDLRTILTWRNNEAVRRWMFNSSEISLDTHLSFVEDLRVSNSKSYWMVKFDDLDLGVVYFVDINQEEKMAEFGLYLNPDLLASGLGFELFYLALNLGFNYLGLHSIISQSKIGNRNTLVLHEFFGMRESHIVQKFISGVAQDVSYRTLVLEDFTKFPQSLNSLKRMVSAYLVANVTSKMK
jgi:UDP-4-amino-4,6-dideoxy-N-acetyl-beta-L-altrosamine N-acetyltransferase